MNTDDRYEVRQFVFKEAGSNDERMCVTSVGNDLMVHTHQNSVKFTDTPIFTFFFATESPKNPHEEYFCKITKTEGLLMRGGAEREMTRIRFSPECRVYPCSAHIELEPSKRVPRPLYTHG